MDEVRCGFCGGVISEKDKGRRDRTVHFYWSECAANLKSTITKQAELIRRLVEVGDRLVKRWWEYHCDETITCKYCGLQQGKFENKHTDDCPITLHTALMNDIEKREG